MKWLEQKKSYGIYEKNHFVDDSTQIRKFFCIGDYSVVNRGCWIENTVIGRFTRIEKSCQIGVPIIFEESFSNHFFAFSEGRNYFKNDDFYQNITTDRLYFNKLPTTYIGSDVRVSEQCIIHAGVTIGDGAIVHPRSVVKDDVESYDIVAGNPAIKIGSRLDRNEELKIENFDWTEIDFRVVFSNSRNNYFNLDHIQNLFYKSKKDLKLREINEYKYNTDDSVEVKTEIAILGPSHIYNWRVNISNGNLSDPPFLLYGDVGMSIYSTAFKRFLDWWILKLDRKAVLLVPDFRVGNPMLGTLSNHEARFIDKDLISKINDLELKLLSLKILSEYRLLYGSKLKFVFWSLYAREQINIRKGKYLDQNNTYSHPYWNYSEYFNEFESCSIDISIIGNRILELIEADDTVHPTLEGYSFLSDFISRNI